MDVSEKTNVQSVSAAEAVSIVSSGDTVFVHTAVASPQRLIRALTDQADRLHDVKICHLHTEGEVPYNAPEYAENFRIFNFFVGANMRRAVQQGRAEFIPVFLSEVPLLFQRNVIPLDVAMLQVSPPDRNGYCTLGVSVDASRAAAQCATKLIAEINPNMPRTHGDGVIHISKFDKVVEVDYPLPTIEVPPANAQEVRIGKYVAELVEDGATLQMGIGAIPNAALEAMTNHKDLGVHTEMFSDGLLDLIEGGAVTNAYKKKHRRYTVTSFLMGSRRLYDFVHDNPMVRVLESDYVNDVGVIQQNPKVTAINSAVEIDLTGQVCADSIGTRIISGVGGQMDFIRGASLSEGGKPIIALPSVTSKGISRISCLLNPGAGVVTTRAHVQYVVTEYGIANLYGHSLRYRAKELIRIAHPDHREQLQKEAFETWKLRTW